MSSSGAGPRVEPGEINMHTGEIRTPSQTLAGAAQASLPVDFLVTISAGEPLAVAVLRVTFESGPDGLHLASAELKEVEPLSE